VLAKKTAKRTKTILSLLLLNALTPINYWSCMLKKGFCKNILTKQAHSGQEKLTASGQETLTNQGRDLRSLSYLNRCLF
jgi:hypothetical protein